MSQHVSMLAPPNFQPQIHCTAPGQSGRVYRHSDYSPSGVIDVEPGDVETFRSLGFREVAKQTGAAGNVI
jgi:hypothetical protein